MATEVGEEIDQKGRIDGEERERKTQKKKRGEEA